MTIDEERSCYIEELKRIMTDDLWEQFFCRPQLPREVDYKPVNIRGRLLKIARERAAWDGYEVHCGMSKFVLLNKNFSTVLKIPFASLAVDHCKAEVEVYEDAVNRGLNSYFATCGYWGKYIHANHRGAPEMIDIYWMEQAEVSPGRVSSYSEGDDGYGTEDATWDCFVAIYSGEEMGKVMEFLGDNDVGDLHASNVGFIGDDLVFIDYSGYNSNEFWNGCMKY